MHLGYSAKLNKLFTTSIRKFLSGCHWISMRDSSGHFEHFKALRVMATSALSGAALTVNSLVCASKYSVRIVG